MGRKKKRGGKRRGAGRPKVKKTLRRVSGTLCLPPYVWNDLKVHSELEGLSRSEAALRKMGYGKD